MSIGTLLWRNVSRNRLRTVLTILALAGSIFLVCAVLTLPSARDTMLAEANKSLRIVVQHKAGLAYSLPLAYAQRVRALPHVVEVNALSWFGGIYQDPKDQFPNYAVEPETLDAVWPDYQWDPALLDAFRRTRNGALIGKRTMQRFDWKIGDEITLRDSSFGLSPTFKVLGAIPDRTGFASALIFPRVYLEEALAEFGGWPLASVLWARVDRLENMNTVVLAIDELFRNSEAQTATKTEYLAATDFLGSFNSVMQVITIVGLLVVAAIILIAANTAAMSVRERIGEMAVLKTLGFRRRMIFRLLIGEGLAVAGLGGIVGAGCAYVILNSGTSTWSPLLGPLGMFLMPVSVVFQAVGLALLVGLLASIIPARRAAKLNITQTLRQIV